MGISRGAHHIRWPLVQLQIQRGPLPHRTHEPSERGLPAERGAGVRNLGVVHPRRERLVTRTIPRRVHWRCQSVDDDHRAQAGPRFRRAHLDSATLQSGEVREVEPLAYWRSEEPAARMVARWAAMLGDAMRARVKAPYQRGWCSWYHYFHGITEDALMSNLRALKEMRLDYPIQVVQLDDGYQAAVGDWKSTNAKFPSGLKKIAATIRDAGFTAGLWTAPFLAARDSRLMREHSDWFIRDENGGPLRAA